MRSKADVDKACDDSQSCRAREVRLRILSCVYLRLWKAEQVVFCSSRRNSTVYQVWKSSAKVVKHQQAQTLYKCRDHAMLIHMSRTLQMNILPHRHIFSSLLYQDTLSSYHVCKTSIYLGFFKQRIFRHLWESTNRSMVLRSMSLYMSVSRKTYIWPSINVVLVTLIFIELDTKMRVRSMRGRDLSSALWRLSHMTFPFLN